GLVAEFWCRVDDADEPAAQVFGQPDGVAALDAGLPERHLLIDRGFGLIEEVGVLETGVHVAPGAMVECHHGLRSGQRGVTYIKFRTGFGGLGALKRPDHASSSSSWLTRVILLSSWSVFASRMSAFIVIEMRAPYGLTASTQDLST